MYPHIIVSWSALIVSCARQVRKADESLSIYCGVDTNTDATHPYSNVMCVAFYSWLLCALDLLPLHSELCDCEVGRKYAEHQHCTCLLSVGWRPFTDSSSGPRSSSSGLT